MVKILLDPSMYHPHLTVAEELQKAQDIGCDFAVLGPVLATASLFLLAWAYAHGETGYLATTEYTSFVYAAVLGWTVFGEPVAATTLMGAAVIVAACLYAARLRDIAQAAVEMAA